MALGTYHGRLLLSPDKSALKDCCCGRDWVVYVGCLITPAEAGSSHFDAGELYYSTHPDPLPDRFCDSILRDDEPLGGHSAGSWVGIYGVCPTSDFIPVCAWGFDPNWIPGTPFGSNARFFSVAAIGYFPTKEEAFRVFSEWGLGDKGPALQLAAICRCGCVAVGAETYTFTGTVSSSPDTFLVGEIPLSLCYGRTAHFSISGLDSMEVYGGEWITVNQTALFYAGFQGNPVRLMGGFWTGQTTQYSVTVQIDPVPAPDCGPDVQEKIASIPRNGEELGAGDLTASLLEELE